MSLVKAGCSAMARGRDSPSDDEDDAARGSGGSGEEEEEGEEGVGGPVLDEILGGFSEDELHEVEDGGTESTRSTAIIARNAQAAQTARGAAPSGGAPSVPSAGQQNNVGDGPSRPGAEDPRGPHLFPPDRAGPGQGVQFPDRGGKGGGSAPERGEGWGPGGPEGWRESGGFPGREVLQQGEPRRDGPPGGGGG